MAVKIVLNFRLRGYVYIDILISMENEQNNPVIINAPLSNSTKMSLVLYLAVSVIFCLAIIGTIIYINLMSPDSLNTANSLIALPVLAVFIFVSILNTRAPFSTVIDTATGLITTSGLRGKRQLRLIDVVSSKKVFMLSHGRYHSSYKGLRLKDGSGHSLYLAVDLFEPEVKLAILEYGEHFNGRGLNLRISKLDFPNG